MIWVVGWISVNLLVFVGVAVGVLAVAGLPADLVIHIGKAVVLIATSSCHRVPCCCSIATGSYGTPIGMSELVVAGLWGCAV